MAGGSSPSLNHCRRLCKSPPLFVDSSVWSTICNYLGSWSSVHKLYMVSSVQVPWYNSLTNDFIPSKIERNSGEVPSPAHSFSTSSTSRIWLVPSSSPEYLWRIQQIIKNTPVAPPHHNSAPPCSEPAQVPPSLLRSTHVFVRKDASKPPLSPLYKKYFSLQVGSKTDSVSMDRLKPVLSEFPVTTQEPPRRGRPPGAQRPPSPIPPLTPFPPTPSLHTPRSTARGSKKRVRFSPPPCSVLNPEKP